MSKAQLDIQAPTTEKYEFKQVEESILAYWNAAKIYAKAKALCDERGRGKKRYYFLDGPPYTSGKVHLGTAWNKSLKDMVLRYKRMTGNAVWDRAGYDMHGLPTENATLKKLGMKTNDDIKEFGVTKFIEECRKLSTENLAAMNVDFKRIGVWMDFDNAYQTISKHYMEGEWWLIKRAHELGRLYEGLRTMTWCATTESALAKHELEYETVEDDSIFVKFKLLEKKDGEAAADNEYLVIWTTTPWTIPFNLAVMAGPEIEYVKVKVPKQDAQGNETGEHEYWYVANALVGAFLGAIVDTTYEIAGSLMGEEMEGWRYRHPFHDELPNQYDEIIANAPKAFTILLSSDYVDTSAGSGLVHTAPGCGPEDYEVGHRNGLPAFNTIDTKGVFPDDMGKFAGWIAKQDDEQFIQALADCGALIASTKVEHEYPHDWRYHKPVIFRTTKQWFFKVEDMKEEMIKANDGISWVPNGAYKAFDNWLHNLRDNSVSKQRYWGTPLPIWRNEAEDAAADDYIVVGSAGELEELSGVKVDDLHIPSVDPVVIKKDGKTYRRVPDVLDVWVDAGTASWNCLDHDPELMKELFPADFILEAKDQIRGWFNLLHICSMVVYGKPSFKACYMHGWFNDAQGRKMSKSVGNYILPSEVIDKYGADTLRYYVIGAANPGVDMNYNFEDVELKHRNLHVFWNVHKFLIDLQRNTGVELKEPTADDLAAEERYILSVLNRTVKEVSEKYDTYALNEVPWAIERCLLELSRTYIQLVRDKAAMGSDEEKGVVLWTAWKVFRDCITMFATLAPFITEQMHQNYRALEGNPFIIDTESIHHQDWPIADEEAIDEQLEQDMEYAQQIISAVLAAREKAKLGVRWPLAKISVETQNKSVEHAATSLRELILQQTNVKEILLEQAPVSPVVKPNYRELGRAFGQETAAVAEAINRDKEALAAVIAAGNDEFTVEGFALKRSMLDITYESAAGSEVAQFSQGLVAAHTELTPELEAEGFLRELVRRVQQLRKQEGLERRDRIVLGVAGERALLARIATHDEFMQEKVGASKLLFTESLPEFDVTKEVTVRGVTFSIGFERE